MSQSKIPRRHASRNLDGPPLTWWHTVPLAQFGRGQQRRLTETLRPLAILGAPRWRDASRGEGEAALSLWAALVRSGRGGRDTIDIVMSTVALAAARGCGACAAVLLRELARRRRQDPAQDGAPADPTEGARTGTDGFYRAYIGSKAWRHSPARLGEIAAAGGACRLCGNGGPTVRLEVHHRTYRRLGRERVEDLTLLCGECHDEVTGFLRARRGPARIPPPPDLLPVRHQALFDPLAPQVPNKD